MFYDHAGMHAAAAVAVAYLRNYWLRAITPQGGYEVGVVPTIANNGLIWFLSYSVPLITVHHIMLFFIEAGGFGYWGLSLGKAFASVLFTSVVLIMQQYLFYVKAR